MKHGEYVRETNKEDNEQLEMFEGKLKSFKNCPSSTKHTFFATEPSSEQVAKSSHQTP